MELRVLKYFLMAAREENITRAAERMHITQPTLSRQLMQLEEELGVSLFKRGKHSISLTEEGLLLKQRAQEMVDLEERIITDFSDNNGALNGIVTIGSGEISSMELLAGQAALFREKHPAVEFRIFSGISDDIKIRIENGFADVGLLTEPVDISKYDFIRMKEKEKWGLLIRKDNKLSEKEYITAKDLVKTPLIMAQRDSVRNEISNWFGEYYDSLNIVSSCDLLYNTMLLVKSGLGSAVCIQSSGLDEELVFRPLKPALETGSVLVWKKNRAQSPAVKGFIDHVKNAFRTLYEM